MFSILCSCKCSSRRGLLGLIISVLGLPYCSPLLKISLGKRIGGPAAEFVPNVCEGLIINERELNTRPKSKVLNSGVESNGLYRYEAICSRKAMYPVHSTFQRGLLFQSEMLHLICQP